MAKLTDAQQEKKWEAESDADTMTRFMEVNDDASRIKAARKILAKRLKETRAVLERGRYSKP